MFWVAAMLGVGLATLLTYLVDLAIEGHGIWEKVAVFVAQLTGFGIVWLALLHPRSLAVQGHPRG